MANPLDCNGLPIPWSSGCFDGQIVDAPICYQVDDGPILNGFKRITLNADCTASSTEILDQALAPVPGAVEVGCLTPTEACCDPESICSLLAQLPVGIPDPTDEVVFVTPTGCVRAVPAMATVDCAALNALFTPAAVAGTQTIYANDAGTCVTFTVDDLCAFCGGSDLCDQIEALDPIAAAGTMEIPVRSPGDGVCSVVTIQDICDFCGGGGAFPLLAPDGDCAAPSYSFTNDTTSGMFIVPGSFLELGWENCNSGIDIGDVVTIYALNGDEIVIGASINITTGGTSNILLTAGNDGSGNLGATLSVNFGVTPFGGGAVLTGGASALGALGGRLSVGGATSTTGGATGVRGGEGASPNGLGGFVSIEGGEGNGTLTGGLVEIRGGACTGTGAGNNVEIYGGQSTAGAAGIVSVSTGNIAVERMAWLAAGELRVGGTVGTTHYVLKSQGPGLPALWDNSSAMVAWGAFNIASTADTRVLPLGYDPGLVSTLSSRGHRAPRGGIYRALFAQHNAAVGNGASVTYTLRINGVPTALSVSLATGAIGFASNLVDEVAVAQGDYVEMLAIKPVSIGSGSLELYVTLGMA